MESNPSSNSYGIGDDDIQTLIDLNKANAKEKKQISVKQRVQLAKFKSFNKGCYTIICGDRRNFFPFIFRTQKEEEFTLKDLDIAEIQMIATGLQHGPEITFILATKYIKLGSFSTLMFPRALPIQCTYEQIFGKPQTSKNLPRNEHDMNNNRNRANSKNQNNELRILALNEISTFTTDFAVNIKCTKKFAIKEINGKNGPLLCLNFRIADHQGTEMECTVFGDTAKELDEKVKEGSCYIIKKPFVKLADKKYCTLKTDYKLAFSRQTTIEEIEEEGEFVKPTISLTKIKDLNSIPTNTYINDVVIILEEPNVRQIERKDGSTTMLSTFKVGDASGFKVETELWDQKAKLTLKVGQICLFTNFKVRDYRGRKLCSNFQSTVEINPNIEEDVNALQRMGANYAFKELNPVGEFMTTEIPREVNYFYEIKKNLEIIAKDVTDSSNNANKRFPLQKVVGTLTYLNHSEKNYYEACPKNDCYRKKLLPENGCFKCPKCDAEYDNPPIVYGFSAKFRDCSGEQWIKFFNENGEKLFGMKAEEYKRILESNDHGALDEINENILFKKFVLFVRPKIDTYNGNTNCNMIPVEMEKLDSATEKKQTSDYYHLLCDNLGLLLKKKFDD